MRAGLLVLWALSACAANAQEIASGRDLGAASAAPAIASITDLGGGDVRIEGTLTPPPGDGVAVVGEALWIQGTSFGRQPTVTVGGRPAAVLTRTGQGGIVVRVPVATPVGQQAVQVTQAFGASARMIEVRRYAAVVSPDGEQLGFASLTEDGPVPVGTPMHVRARHLCMSSDGRAAYLAGVDGAGSVELTTFDLAAAGQPGPVGRLDLGPESVGGLLCALAAHRAVVLRAHDVLLMNTASALRPAREEVVPLPAVVGPAPPRGALSPDGRRLALLLAGGNRVALWDMTAQAAPVVVPLPSGVPVAVLIDLAFAPDGRTLWVLSGDTDASRPSGPQPVRLYALRLTDGSPLSVTMARSVTIDRAADPVRLSTGRSLPLQSGAAIRLPPEKATVYFSAGQRDGRGSTARAVAADASASELINVDGALGELDVSPDGRWLLATGTDADGSVRLVSAAADGRPGRGRSVVIVPAPKQGHASTRAPGLLRIQP